MGEKVILVYLVVCFFVFLAGFVDSIAGGGGLISLPAYMIAGLPVHTAIATNKMSSFMGTSVATYHYMKKGFMKWKICIPAIFGAIAGSWMGSHLALLISDRVLKIAMVIVLPVILFYVLRSKALQGNDENTTDAVNGMLIFKCILIAVVIGIYDGIYGPGTTKAINLTTNITALVVFLINGKVLLPLGIAAGCCNMAGNYLGSHSFTSNGHKIVKPVMIVVIVIFFIKVVMELI